MSGRWRIPLAWGVVLTGVHLGLALPRLTAVPRAIMDESWEACTAYTLAQEGRLRTPVLDRYGMDRAFIQPRITQYLVLAGTYELLGFSFRSGRLASVLVGWATVIGVFYAMRTWLSYKMAGLIALLFAVDSPFFLVTRLVRPEVYVLCASVWMLALLGRGTVRPSFWRCFGAGLIGGVGCYTHPNMVLVVVVGLPLMAYSVGFRRQLIPGLAGYGLGGIVAVLPFIAYVVWAQVHHQVSFVEQLGRFYTDIADSLGSSSPLEREIQRWFHYLRPVERGPWILLLAAGVVWGAIRRHPIQVYGLALTLGHALLMLVLIKSLSPRSLVVLSPWFAAFIGLWVRQCWDWTRRLTAGKRSVMQALTVLCACGAFAVNLAGNAYVIHAYRQADYDAVCQRIRRHIPLGSRVFGNLVFWTGLYQYPYLSEIGEAGGRVDRIVPLWRERFRAFAPEFVVRSSTACRTLEGLGPRQAEFDRDVAPSSSYKYYEAIFTRFCDRYIKAHGGVLLDRFTTHDFGTIEVYALAW